MINKISLVYFSPSKTKKIIVTARKLGVIICTMVTKKAPYNPPTEYLFLAQKSKMGLVKRIMKQMVKFEIE